MGAPTAETLDWDKDELLDAPVAPFYARDACQQEHWPFSGDHGVKWRSLQERKSREDTEAVHNGDAQFFTTQDLAATGSSEPELSLFYSHSFSIHETSEVSSGESNEDSGLGPDSTASFESSSDRGVATITAIPGGLGDLKDIPNAGYLRSIIPQTMTVNLIVSVITIYPPRRVMTRQEWKKEQDIVEMVVGDETKSGFSVTFWLAPESGHHDDSLRSRLAGLRPRDIVLLRAVALSSFLDRVYGQSLRKGMTQVDLLHRQRVDVTDSGGVYSLRRIQAARENDQMLRKVGRVREWIKRFVDEKDRGGQFLPPDTQ